MKKHEHLSTAKALVGLLVLSIVVVLFYKFHENQELLFTDLSVLRNFVALSIVGSGFLIGLYYLVSQTSHPKAPSKPSKTSKKKKK
jgi:multisubunit Na+/H+ antiporter MnhB subunit